MESKQVVLIILTAMFLWFGYSVYPPEKGLEVPIESLKTKVNDSVWSSPISGLGSVEGSSVQAILWS